MCCDRDCDRDCAVTVTVTDTLGEAKSCHMIGPQMLNRNLYDVYCVEFTA